MKSQIQPFFLSGSLLSFALILSALAEEPPASFDEKAFSKALGKDLGGKFLILAPFNPEDVSRLSTLAEGKILGTAFDAFQGEFDIPLEETPDFDFYVLGKKIWVDHFSFEHEGWSTFKATLSPVEFRVPAIIYPVGPLLLQVDGGARFEASAVAEIHPTLMIPIEQSFVTAWLKPEGYVAGFVEGYAKLAVIRGGIGGQVSLLEGRAEAKSQIFFNGRSPTFDFSGMITFLKGRLYAFIDFFNPLKWKWKRQKDFEFFQWKGICRARGQLQCP